MADDGLAIDVVTLTDSARTAAEAAAALGCEVGQIVKSLVFMRDGEPLMVLCAGDRRVAADRLGLTPANADQARAATGFAIGGIPPLGHATPLATGRQAAARAAGTRRMWAGSSGSSPRRT